MLRVFYKSKRELKGEVFTAELASDNKKDYFFSLVNSTSSGEGGSATFPFTKEELIILKESINDILDLELAEKSRTYNRAIMKASEVLGVDPAYYGVEGQKELDRQLELMGYNPMDFRNDR